MSGPALQNLTDQTVTAIQDMISRSGLNPGEPFAREADLEKQLNVSRVVLREALSRLRAIGLVESRQRVGLIVAKPDPVNLFEQAIAGGNLDTLDLEQLADLRYALEIGAVDLATRRATDEQLEQLLELAEEFADTNAGRVKKRTIDDIELEFHRTILEATHSRILMQMHSVLNAFFVRAAAEIPSYSAETTTENSVAEHRRIAQAFQARDTEQASSELRNHLAAMFDNEASKEYLPES